MRVALGFGGIAALSALSAAIVLPPRPVTSVQVAADRPVSISGDTGSQVASSSAPSPATPQTSPTILYIQLAPGQTAPPGATVIDAAAAPKAGGILSGPAPIAKQPATVQAAPTQAAVIAVAPPKPAPKPIVVKTAQSGKVAP
jgi:hypothetical protein